MIKVQTKISKNGKKKILTEIGGGKNKTTISQLILEMADLLESVHDALESGIDDDQELIDALSIYAQLLSRATMRAADTVTALVRKRNGEPERDNDQIVKYDPQFEDPEDELAKRIRDDADDNA